MADMWRIKLLWVEGDEAAERSGRSRMRAGRAMEAAAGQRRAEVLRRTTNAHWAE